VSISRRKKYRQNRQSTVEIVPRKKNDFVCIWYALRQQLFFSLSLTSVEEKCGTLEFLVFLLGILRKKNCFDVVLVPSKP
jgi:hypothetical protein